MLFIVYTAFVRCALPVCFYFYFYTHRPSYIGFTATEPEQIRAVMGHLTYLWLTYY